MLFLMQVPAPSLGHDMAQLLESGTAADVRFKVEEEELAAHKFILTARSPVFRSDSYNKTLIVEPVFRSESCAGPVQPCCPQGLTGVSLKSPCMLSPSSQATLRKSAFTRTSRLLLKQLLFEHTLNNAH